MTVEIVGCSPSLRRALTMVERFAPTPLPILLVGATGTGKELFAQRIHELSRRAGRLVAVNCAALPREMVEALLFGHGKGAYTGAVEAKIGFVEAAARGTLFLDELSSLSTEGQVKLLRVLESKDVIPLGETRARPVDFRVVASVQDDLPACVATGALRLDLYERVAGVVVELLPLRERPEDLALLAEHFAARHGRTLEPGSVAVLRDHGWPGNVRELRAAMERAGFLSDNGTIAPRQLAEAIALGAPGAVYSGALLRTDRDGLSERARLVTACREHGWDARRAAAALGIARSTLYDRLRAAHLSLRRLRSESRALENCGNSGNSSGTAGIPAARSLPS